MVSKKSITVAASGRLWLRNDVVACVVNFGCADRERGVEVDECVSEWLL